MMGFQPPTCGRPRRAVRQRSVRGGCSASSDVLSPGFIRRGAGLWRGTFGPRRTDRLTHTALILGGLERGRFTSRLLRPGGTAASAPSFGTSPGCLIRGTPTGAPTPESFWLGCSTMTHNQHSVSSTAHVRKPDGRRKVGKTAPCRLPPAFTRRGSSRAAHENASGVLGTPEDAGIRPESL